MFNANKAGLENVDKASVSRVIEEASRGTPFWEHEQRRNARHEERIQKALHKIANASEQEKASAEQWAAVTVARLGSAGGDLSRHIAHVDMDAFYASVEERANPSLRSMPMAVGSISMLSTSNYAARRFGVRAGLPGFIAKKLCPDLVLVPVDRDKYERASEEVMTLLAGFDPRLHVFGLDEAALDITAQLTVHNGAAEPKRPEQVAAEIRALVLERTGLTCSVGVASNGLLAKICADVNKPDGQFRLESAKQIEEFLAPLGVRKIPGLGQVQEKILSAMGIDTCGDLSSNGDTLLLAFGPNAAEGYLRAAKGIGSTFGGAESSSRPKAVGRKSKSAEATFRESSDPAFLADVVAQLSERLGQELRDAKLLGRLVSLKVKSANYDVYSRSIALEVPTNSADVMCGHSRRILNQLLSRRPDEAIRLLGVKMANLMDEASEQALQAGGQTTLTQMMSAARPRTTQQPPASDRQEDLLDKLRIDCGSLDNGDDPDNLCSPESFQDQDNSRSPENSSSPGAFQDPDDLLSPENPGSPDFFRDPDDLSSPGNAGGSAEGTRNSPELSRNPNSGTCIPETDTHQKPDNTMRRTENLGRDVAETTFRNDGDDDREAYKTAEAGEGPRAASCSTGGHDRFSPDRNHAGLREADQHESLKCPSASQSSSDDLKVQARQASRDPSQVPSSSNFGEAAARQPAPGPGPVLIDETYCPVCAVIMRNVSELAVQRHVDACLKRNASPPPHQQAPSSNNSNSSKKKAHGAKRKIAVGANAAAKKKKPDSGGGGGGSAAEITLFFKK